MAKVAELPVADEPRFTTSAMLAVEQSVLDLALQRRTSGAGLATAGDLDGALEARPNLYPDQRAMVEGLTTSGLGVEVVVGRAGAGKTFALDAARDAWQRSGHRVIGCALSARAAQELESGAGIDSYTIAALLQDLEHEDATGLGQRAVVVVDEAAMVGTRDLHRLLLCAADADAKVVLVGDDRQLPEIAAGGAFRAIKNRLPTIELRQMRRQPFGWERDTLDLLREGEAKAALNAYEGHDRVVIERTAEKTRRRLVKEWWERYNLDEPAVMVAMRRSDVADLNARARALLVAAGHVGESGVEAGDIEIAVGDRVMTLRNHRHLGVVNGTRGVVRGIDVQNGSVVMQPLRSDQVVTLPASYVQAGHVAHSYAFTAHKAQGLTTEMALVLGDETLYREWAYTAMSRGKQENRLYVVTGVDPGRDEVGGAIAKADDPRSELIRALGRSQAKELALDVFEHASVKGMSTPELRGRVEELTALLQALPPENGHRLDDDEHEHNQIKALIDHHVEVRDRGRRELHDIGALAKLRDRSRVNDITRRVRDADDTITQLSESLHELDARIEQARAQQHRRDAWLTEHAPELAELDAVGRELWWREHQRALTAEVGMPSYLARAVGERPVSPSARASWREKVRAVESFRTRWGVTDSDQALGAEDESSQQRAERASLDNELAQAASDRRRSRDRSSSDRGVSR